MTVRFNASKVIGLALLVGGLLYLMDQFHVFQNLGLTFTGAVLWPMVLVVIGLYGLDKFRYGRTPWFSIFLLLLGVLLVLKNSTLVPILGQIGAWTLFWCLLLIVAGLYMLLPKRRRLKVKVQVNDEVHEVDVEDVKNHWKDWKHQREEHASWRWLGDISFGKQPWTLKDLDLWNAVGDIRVNLTTAHIENGTHHITIGGWVGDVRVLVPEDLAVKIKADVSIGDLKVFNDEHSGTGRHVTFVDPLFDTADKRVVIHISLKIGDVQVVRV